MGALCGKQDNVIRGVSPALQEERQLKALMGASKFYRHKREALRAGVSVLDLQQCQAGSSGGAAAPTTTISSISSSNSSNSRRRQQDEEEGEEEEARRRRRSRVSTRRSSKGTLVKKTHSLAIDVASPPQPRTPKTPTRARTAMLTPKAKDAGSSARNILEEALDGSSSSTSSARAHLTAENVKVHNDWHEAHSATPSEQRAHQEEEEMAHHSGRRPASSRGGAQLVEQWLDQQSACWESVLPEGLVATSVDEVLHYIHSACASCCESACSSTLRRDLPSTSADCMQTSSDSESCRRWEEEEEMSDWKHHPLSLSLSLSIPEQGAPIQ